MYDEFGFAMNPPEAFQPRGRGSMRLHGGKSRGSSAAAPDPRLVEAQIRSMGITDRSIERILTNSEEMAPLQRQQLQDSISRGTSLYGQGQEDRSYGLQRRGVLTGLQDRMVKDANEFNTADRREQLAAEAQADVTSAYDNAAAMQARGLERSGVNPNSGKYMAMQNQNSLARAASSASAANKTRQAARLEGFQLNDRASNAFSGYPASTASSVGMGLNTARFGLDSANTGLAGMNSGYTAAGGMAGQMGQNASGMYGAMGSFKNGQDQIAAQNDPMNTILGAAAGGLASSFKFSDRRLKTQIRRIGATDAGLPIYTYRYIAGGGVQVGVMADEVTLIVPSAVTRMSNGYDAVDYSKI